MRTIFLIVVLFLFNDCLSNRLEEGFENQTSTIYSLLDTNPDSAFSLSEELYSKAKNLNLPYHMANSLYIRAWILDQKNTKGESFLMYLEALNILKDIPNQNTQESGLYIVLMNDLALVLNEHLETNQSLDYLKEAMKLAHLNSNPEEIWRISYSLATIFENQERYDSAYNYSNKAFEIIKESGDYHKVNSALIKKALLLEKMELYDSARDILHSLITQSEHQQEIGSFYKAVALHNIGNTYFLQNDYQQAIEYYLSSAKIKSLDKEAGMKYTALTDICEAYLKTGNTKEALHYGLKADSIYAQVNLIPENYRLFEFLSDIYFDMGEYEKSHYFTNRHFDENKKFLANQEEIRRIKNTYNMQPLAAGFLLSLQKSDKDSIYLLLLRIISILFTLTLIGGICYQYFVRKSISKSIIQIEKNSRV